LEAPHVFHRRPRVQGRSPRLPELPGTEGAFKLRRTDSSRPRPHALLRVLPLGARSPARDASRRGVRAGAALTLSSAADAPGGRAPTPDARASGVPSASSLAKGNLEEVGKKASATTARTHFTTGGIGIPRYPRGGDRLRYGRADGTPVAAESAAVPMIGVPVEKRPRPSTV